MKVGNLIKVNTARWPALASFDGQLGIIVRFLTNNREEYPWEVRLTNGEVFWFEDKELQVINENR
jgi:hypothetical protein